jgi:hypothetical protein
MQICLSLLLLLLPPPACAPMHAASYASLGKATHTLLAGGWVWRGGCQQPCGLRLAGWSGEGMGVGKM